MKKLIALIPLCYFLLTGSVTAQQSPGEIQKQIDQQVWKPFKKAFESLDGKALNKLYAKEVLRVTPAGIDTENSFKTANLERFRQRKKEGTAISLDFWFESRHTNQSSSYEVGIFRITSVTEGNENTVFGQFHIVLKKTKGTWKITQDWDSNLVNGQPITAEDFARKSPIDLN